MQRPSADQLAYTQPQLYINGQWLGIDGRQAEDVINPATGAVLARLPHATPADLDAALAAAQRAFCGWRAVAPLERSRILRAAAALLRERADAIAHGMTLEQGKPLREARLELLASADTFDWHAEEGRRNYGRVVPGRHLHQRITVLHEPVGVCAAFTPWNFPAITPARKMAGALAAGCTLIIKLAEETPATGLALVRALHDAGLPAGVLNAVFGVPAEVSTYLLDSPIVAKFSFTGSTAVGKQLAQQAARSLKRATMELGGHAPAIVCADAEVERAADMLIAGKFRNAGQVCISPTRFLVHESVRNDFAAALARHAQSLKVGDGLAEGTQMGPLANPRRVVAMTSLLEDAVQRGATVAAGGVRLGEQGNFFAPTVITDVPLDARVFNDEPFGPVAAIRGFNTLEEAIAEANRLPYGLAAYAFTRSLKNAHLLSQRVEAGMLWINQPALPLPEMPFGGVKDSGYGSEGGPEALEPYLNSRAVSIANV